MFHVCDPRGTSVTLGSWSLFSRRWLGRLIGLGAATRPRETMRPTRCVPGLMRGSRARGGKGGGVGERGGDRARDRGRGEDGSAGLGQRFARARRGASRGRAEARRAGAGRGARLPGRGDERVVAAADARDPGGRSAGTADRAGSDGSHLDVIVADLMMATTEAAGDGAARAVPDDRDRERRRTRARLTVRAGSNDGRRERGLHPRPDPEAEAPASVPPRARANAAGAGAPIFRRAEHQLTRTARVSSWK